MCVHVKVTRMFVWVCGSVLSCWRARALGFRVCVGVHVSCVGVHATLSAVVGFRVLCVQRPVAQRKHGEKLRVWVSTFGFRVQGLVCVCVCVLY